MDQQAIYIFLVNLDKIQKKLDFVSLNDAMGSVIELDEIAGLLHQMYDIAWAFANLEGKELEERLSELLPL